jgi:hypothetical protein
MPVAPISMIFLATMSTIGSLRSTRCSWRAGGVLVGLAPRSPDPAKVIQHEVGVLLRSMGRDGWRGTHNELHDANQYDQPSCRKDGHQFDGKSRAAPVWGHRGRQPLGGGLLDSSLPEKPPHGQPVSFPSKHKLNVALVLTGIPWARRPRDRGPVEGAGPLTNTVTAPYAARQMLRTNYLA